MLGQQIPEDQLLLIAYRFLGVSQSTPNVIQQIIGTAIEDGSIFLKDSVLSGASAETIEDFKGMNTEIIMFILTRAVCIFCTGDIEKEALIPNFFKPGSKDRILALRQELNGKEKILEALKSLTENPDNFAKDPQDDDLKSALSKMKNIAAGELQAGLLSSKCWERSIAMLEEDSQPAASIV